jgi:hypothetical protein
MLGFVHFFQDTQDASMYDSLHHGCAYQVTPHEEHDEQHEDCHSAA